jgi:hypothetical protein
MRFIQVLNVGIIPLLVIVAGLIRASRRRNAALFARIADNGEQPATSEEALYGDESDNNIHANETEAESEIETESKKESSNDI